MTTSARWQEIDRIFAAALERDPAVREAFLDGACSGDEQLRAEVESLLANDIPESLVRLTPSRKTGACYRRRERSTIKRIGRYPIIRPRACVRRLKLRLQRLPFQQLFPFCVNKT